eukprot:TRINITY_DN12656_c0_g1_i1.p1 TRINITY_DN12656_c0_g1~~TRINITY_DN12656_c0_g1_i1.p1  ORF type:complete len:350 (+),score=61.04 TRINITY_DN12656_c0_g1_i1:83-1051(+)
MPFSALGEGEEGVVAPKGGAWASFVEKVKEEYVDQMVVEHGHEVTLDYGSLSSLWVTLNAKYQPFHLFIAFYTFLTLCYWGTGFLFIIIEQARLFDSYKIHAGVYNTWAEYSKCFKNLLVTYAFFILPSVVVGWPVLTHSGMAFDGASVPSFFTWVLHTAICFAGEDFLQYIFHRLLHMPILYKRVHKLHHEFQAPFALAGSYAHPIEVAFLAVATFLPAIILRPHFVTFLSWIWLRQMDAVIEHCGYYIPSPFHILPFYGGVVFHDYHHTAFTLNYASRFDYWDRLFGTYKEPPAQYGTGIWNDDKRKKARLARALAKKGY